MTDQPAWRAIVENTLAKWPSDDMLAVSLKPRFEKLLLSQTPDRDMFDIMGHMVHESLCGDWFITVWDIAYFQLTGKHCHFMLAARFKEPMEDRWDWDYYKGVTDKAAS